HLPGCGFAEERGRATAPAPAGWRAGVAKDEPGPFLRAERHRKTALQPPVKERQEMQKESGTGPQQQVGLWYSVDGKPFAGSEPFFFDPADHPWVAEVESQWEVIRDELSEFIRTNDHRLEPYIEADMVSRPKKWR